MEIPNIMTEMQSKYVSMSDVEKKIADYIFNNPVQIVYMTTHMLSKEINVSEGSIINFAKSLGCAGFKNLKINIARNVDGFDHYEFNNIQETDNAKAAFQKMMENAVHSFRTTYDLIRLDTLENAANMLMNAKSRIELYGVGSSSMVAQDAYYRLMRIGLPAYAVTDPHISSVSASMLDENCVALGVSYTGRTNETLGPMKIAKSKNAKTICLTGYADSPLANLCDITLLVVSRESEVYKEAVVSRLTQLLILESLCSYIAFKRKDTYFDFITSMTEILGEHRK